MPNAEKELLKRGKPIEEIDHTVTDRIDAQRDARLETVKQHAAAETRRKTRSRSGRRR